MGDSDPAVYALVSQLLQAVLRPTHATSFVAVSSLVWAVLCAQSLHPVDLVRALPDLATAHARQGFRRVQRGLQRGCLTSAVLTPPLVSAVLSAPAAVELAARGRARPCAGREDAGRAQRRGSSTRRAAAMPSA